MTDKTSRIGGKDLINIGQPLKTTKINEPHHNIVPKKKYAAKTAKIEPFTQHIYTNSIIDF